MAEAGRIRFLGDFAAPATEQAFRQKHLPDDLWLSRLCVLAAMFRVALFVHVDFQHLGPGAPFFALLGARALVLVMSVCVWRALRRSVPPSGADRLLSSWCLLLAAFTVCGLSTRPPAAGASALLSVVTVLAVYCVVPLPLARQAFLGVSFSIAALVVAVRGDGTIVPVLGGAFLMINALGVVVSWQSHHRRRLVFAAAVRETGLRRELEQALAEVRTLRGVLPICAWCKRIRDEAEAWRPVEEYLKAHTHAAFTHGICPQCVTQQFDERALQS
jgi:hypothetical protein